ncbi:2-oxoglutarate and iron-dependent oxygenase JMJD4 homolog [Dendroctonus ponderosae]|uniref:Jumonji domain-containing protein 4 n=1 Tax=Dendroctonus ponderosae TaxID=77166 RepID=U4U9W4_DENPD|nr:2-oxoglutarate and iron-dependent oxygenase JMJD4 homolog [Dendroctonus ponderosae]ERL89143.1 hypothetical protein D910_06519 [Dendroctonus ponderosae]
MEFEISPTLAQKEIIQNECLTVPVLQQENLSYQDFFEQFMVKNLPCIIKNVARDWQATNKWVNEDQPQWQHLNTKYGHTKVIIYNCSQKYFNSQKCRESTLDEYLALIRNPTEDIYYLKDWHLKLQCKTDNFYQVPVYFASDWLNEYFTECTDDDYRFVYMGQKSSWTPLHADVFNSFSWSVNVCGQKRWIFFPPGEELLLRDSLNNIPYDIKEIPKSRKCFEVIQNAGDAIFVPSGWYHQVWNLKDTISINHNWVNGCNIYSMWSCLKNSLEATKREIDDCKGMDNFEEHCQTMLDALFGINYNKFYTFLEFIANRRLNVLKTGNKTGLYHGHIIGINHAVFDLNQICKVLGEFLSCDHVNKSQYFHKAQSLLHEVFDIIKKRNTKHVIV